MCYQAVYTIAHDGRKSQVRIQYNNVYVHAADASVKDKPKHNAFFEARHVSPLTWPIATDP